MQEKTIHIVFQVLNFLSHPLSSSSYDLSPDEKLILIFLSKHHGQKGIYPSVHTLSRELQRHHTCIRKTLKKLVKKNLLKIQNIPGKSSNYTLLIPSLELSTGVRTHAQGSETAPYAPVHTQGTHPCVGGTHRCVPIRKN